jgi:hypothetical protein
MRITTAVLYKILKANLGLVNKRLLVQVSLLEQLFTLNFAKLINMSVNGIGDLL